MYGYARLLVATAAFATSLALTTGTAPAAEIPRIGLQHQVGDAPGFEENYSRIQAFVPLFGRHEDWLAFGDAQGMIDNRGALSNSIGFGFRVAPGSGGRVFGIHTHYDYREFDFSHGDFDFHRWGAGVEALSELWAARANVYVNASGRQIERVLVDPTPRFVDRFLQIGIAHSSYVEALHGVDYEIGRLLPLPFGLPIDHEVTVGGYYWDTSRGDGHHAPGVKGGLQTWWSDSLVTYVQAAYDRVFESSVNGGFVWYFGGPSTRPSARAESLAARMANPVRRQYEIPVLNYREEMPDSAVFATDAATGQRVTFAHVDDDAAPGGSGTSEHPLSRLQDASQSSADVVLVQNGIYRNDFIALSPGQRLLAVNERQFVETAERGSLQLPGTGIGGTSTILNAPGTAIILANSTEVEGFTIADPLHHGIFGEGISNVQIRRNIVAGAGVNGVSLGSLNGFGILEDNRIVDSGGDGVRIVTGNARLTVTDNVVQGNSGQGILIDGNDVTATIDGNVSNLNVRSGLVVGMRSRLIGDIANNQTNSNGQYGIRFSSDGVLDGSVIDNTANGNGTQPGFAPGIEIRSLRGITGSISHNIAHDNASSGIIAAANEGRIGGDVVNNFATGNGSAGIAVGGRDGVDGEVSGNVANRNGVLGIFVRASAGRIGGRVANNVALENARTGITIGAGFGVDGDIVNNRAEGNESTGIAVEITAPGADYAGSVLNNIASENGTTGFEFSVADDFTGSFTNNAANLNGTYGFNTFAGGTVTGTTSGNTAVGNDWADFNGNIAQP